MSADGEALEGAWQQVIEAWDDDGAHQRFVALCGTLGVLAEAGRRYREVRDTDPARADRAKAQIDRVLVAAMAGLATVKTEPGPAIPRWVLTLVAFAVSATVIAVALSALLRAA